jgi:hypothetical protein
MLSVERDKGSLPESTKLPPRITPMPRRLDKRNPDLSFSIDTDGRPFYRVLLTNRAELFDPSNAGQRSERNFFDSMRDGLQPFDGAHSHYLVRRPDLRALLPAQAIFYTVIAYEDQAGQRAAYAIPPEQLARSAPSVAVASDFSAESLGFVLATAVENLTRVGRGLSFGADLTSEIGEDRDPAGTPVAPAGMQATAYANGEDTSDVAEDERLAAAAAAEGEPSGDDVYDDGFGASESFASEGFAAEEPGEDIDEPGAAAHGLAALESESSDEYDDGYDGAVAAAAAAAEESPAFFRDPEVTALGGEFAEGSAPGMLYDEEADATSGAAASQGEDAADPDAVDIEEGAGAAAHASGLGFGFSADELGESYGAEPGAALQPFDVEARKSILARIAPFESGKDGFARVEADGEYEGRFGTNHPAYQRYHLGLTFGAFPFVQENGTLGLLLELMRERDPAGYAQTFGPHADELITVTKAGGTHASQSPDGISPRLEPVEKRFLWREPWLSRFKAAGAHPLFQAAQNELASRLYIDPVVPFARGMGITSARGLTLLVDRAVQMGAADGMLWVAEAADPLPTLQQQQQALAVLGHADIAAFQRSAGLSPSGQWDAPTGAALVAALRASGRSPVPLPEPSQLADMVVRRAAGTPWEERAKRLSAAVTPDVLYKI